MTMTTFIRRMPSHLVFLVPLVLGVTRSEDVSVLPEAGRPTHTVSARQAQVEGETSPFEADVRAVEADTRQARRDPSDECGASLGLIERFVGCRSADLWRALP